MTSHSTIEPKTRAMHATAAVPAIWVLLLSSWADVFLLVSDDSWLSSTDSSLVSSVMTSSMFSSVIGGWPVGRHEHGHCRGVGGFREGSVQEKNKPITYDTISQAKHFVHRSMGASVLTIFFTSCHLLYYWRFHSHFLIVSAATESRFLCIQCKVMK